MIIYRRALTDHHLRQILEIQGRSIKGNVSSTERIIEGYVTAAHTFELLKKMNDACPHIVAMKNDTVVGYALAMPQSFRNELAVLIPMFAMADQLLPQKNYLVMGQVCVDKPYRGQGIFRGMYNYYKNELSSEYDCLFTAVDTANTRSSEAHKQVGFEILKTQITETKSWEFINWDWNEVN